MRTKIAGAGQSGPGPKGGGRVKGFGSLRPSYCIGRWGRKRPFGGRPGAGFWLFAARLLPIVPAPKARQLLVPVFGAVPAWSARVSGWFVAFGSRSVGPLLRSARRGNFGRGPGKRGPFGRQPQGSSRSRGLLFSGAVLIAALVPLSSLYPGSGSC